MQPRSLTSISDSVSVRVNNLKNTSTNNNKHKTLSQVNMIADKLVQSLNNPSRLNLYRKYAWHLPEHRIWFNLETALAGKNPQALFTWLCQQELQK